MVDIIDEYTTPINITVGTGGEVTLYERFDAGAAIRNINDASWSAQTFTVGTTGTNVNHFITSVKLKIYRLVLPGVVTVGIRATANGLPIGEDLTSGTIDGNTLLPSWTDAYTEIPLTPYLLLASTMYAIVVRATTGNGDNRIRWICSDIGGYTGGSVVYSHDSGLGWTNSEGTVNSSGLPVTLDFAFQEWGRVII
jgi:hypothetical protein